MHDWRKAGKLILFMLIAIVIGCDDANIQSLPIQPSPDAEPAASLEPGFYESGHELDRINSILMNSTARISLDFHQGIQWYDGSNKTWKNLDGIEDVEPLLNSAESKYLVSISTGKAVWDKCDTYVELIAKYSKSAGFRTLVVTDAHSRGLIVSKVIQLK